MHLRQSWKRAVCAALVIAGGSVQRAAYAQDPPPPSPPPPDPRSGVEKDKDEKMGAKDPGASDATQPGADLHMNDKVDDANEKSQLGASSPARSAVAASSAPPQKLDENDPDKKFTVGGYVETFYQWNFNRPGNGITNQRGYDTLHNTLTLQNAVVDVGFRAHDLIGRLALQTGTAPSSIYSQEPSVPGTDGAGESNPQLWRYVQRASIGWQATDALLLEAGLFLTTFGVEGVAVKDRWTWSRELATTRLPTYLTGVKGTWHVTGRTDVSVGVVNGWNRVVDDNDEKTVIATLAYKLEKQVTAQVSYYGGVERPAGAPEGRAWRHTGEGFVQIDPLTWLAAGAHAIVGLEDTRFGAARYAGISGSARLQAAEWLSFAGRLEGLWEDLGGNQSGHSSPILVSAGRVVSETATVDVHPVKGLSVRTELRHDDSDDPLFFRGDDIQGHGTPADPYIANTRHQSTVLLGVAAWF